MARRIAVVGGGWAGISAAVAALEAGHQVQLFEMAPQLGGRARRVDHDPALALDNGQHILIGAYRSTLALMRRVGADPETLLQRLPLTLVGPDGTGLRLPCGAPVPAFVRGVLGRAGWTLGERLGLLGAALQWRLAGFETSEANSVAQLTQGLSEQVRRTLIEPLCVAALNTPADQASAQVFLRVLKDALFSGPGSADLLLPRWRLSALWPDPAGRWLAAQGASVQLSHRVDALSPRADGGWDVDGTPFDAVVLACTAHEAARLTEGFEPGWADTARGLRYEPIVTVYAHSPETRLPQPMMALRSDSRQPAQFVFDLGILCGMEGVLAFVVSGAAPWVAQGADATMAATLRQGQQALSGQLRAPLTGLRAVNEKRATFLCTPGLKRPPMAVRPGLFAAGDYTDGPYPATLEGAIRAGLSAGAALDA